MTRNVPAPERAAELDRLKIEYKKAVVLAGDMLRATERPGQELAGEALVRFLEAEEKATALGRLIRKIEGGA